MNREPVESELFHLEESAIRESQAFARSPQLRRLVRFLVEAAIAGREVSEYEIATSPLGRNESFDPTTDAIVRKEMRRLRDRLQRFYETEGRFRDWQVLLPPGPYRAILRRRLRVHSRTAHGVVRIQHCAVEAAGFVDRDGWLSGVADDFLTALLNTRGIEVLVPIEEAPGTAPNFRLLSSVRRFSDHTYELRVRLVHPESGKIEWQGAHDYTGCSCPDQFHDFVERLASWAAGAQQATRDTATFAA